MSSIEERLARDIADVTGGVVVTESDLKSARDAVEERSEGRQRRDRRRTVAAAAVAAVMIPILAVAAVRMLGDEQTAPPVDPGPSSEDAHDTFLTGNAPTPERIQGVWRVDNETLLVRFSSPDVITFDNGGRLFDNPAVLGSYEIAGDLITVTVSGGLAGCAGQTFAMRASLPKPGAMRFVHTQPGAGNCSPSQDERWVLEQVLPTSASLAELTVPRRADWEPLAGPAALYGVWLAHGGGHVLEIDAEGSYHVADESGERINRGRWSQRGSELTLTSTAASGSCSEGDRIVWGELEQVDPGTPFMRGTVESDACDAGWTSHISDMWILLPHESS